MVARDFIDENKILLGEAEKSIRYTEEELFTYLQNAYNLLQRDLPQFFEQKSFETIKDMSVYYFDYEILDGIRLGNESDEYQKVSIDLFGRDEYNKVYMIKSNSIEIKPAPFKDGDKLKFDFWRIKKLQSLDNDLSLMSTTFEPLRLLFLSRCYEKMPKVNDRDLSIHYFKRYQAEIAQEKNKTKQRHRFVKTKFKLI